MAQRNKKNNDSEHRYKANLQRVGTLIPETIRILKEYSKGGSWEEVRERVVDGNLIGKGSTRTLDGILSAIHRRYLINRSPLPNSQLLAKFLAKELPANTKAQVLYPYICMSDLLIKDTVIHLVGLKLSASINPILTKSSILEFLDMQTRNHPELNEWSDYLKRRWTRGFLALLRDFGLMEKAPKYGILIPTLRVESFMFLFLGLLGAGLTGTNALNHEIWRLYLLNHKHMETLVIESQSQGWLQYSRAGDIVEIQTLNRSLEEWLNDLG